MSDGCAPSTKQQILDLRLYIAGDAPNSVRAVSNLQAILKAHAADHPYRLEIVDVLKEPSQALQRGILITPTLLCLSDPVVRIVGNLSERTKVLAALGLLEA